MTGLRYTGNGPDVSWNTASCFGYLGNRDKHFEREPRKPLFPRFCKAETIYASDFVIYRLVSRLVLFLGGKNLTKIDELGLKKIALKVCVTVQKYGSSFQFKLMKRSENIFVVDSCGFTSPLSWNFVDVLRYIFQKF